jgi:hypothetical protein
MATSEPQQKPLADVPFLPSRHTGLLMAAVMVMSVCQFIDMTVANVALPHMQTSLNASMDTISWTLFAVSGSLGALRRSDVADADGLVSGPPRDWRSIHWDNGADDHV